MATSPQAHSKRLVATLVRELSDAGLAGARIEIKPDGCVILHTTKIEQEHPDDFLSGDLRMGKK